MLCVLCLRMLGPLYAWQWSLVVMALDLMHVLHSSLNILPMYALAMANHHDTVLIADSWLEQHQQ